MCRGRTHLAPLPVMPPSKLGRQLQHLPRSESDEGRAGLRLMTLACQPRALCTEHVSPGVPGGVRGCTVGNGLSSIISGSEIC